MSPIIGINLVWSLIENWEIKNALHYLSCIGTCETRTNWIRKQGKYSIDLETNQHVLIYIYMCFRIIGNSWKITISVEIIHPPFLLVWSGRNNDHFMKHEKRKRFHPRKKLISENFNEYGWKKYVLDSWKETLENFIQKYLMKRKLWQNIMIIMNLCYDVEVTKFFKYISMVYVRRCTWFRTLKCRKHVSALCKVFCGTNPELYHLRISLGIQLVLCSSE